MAKNERRYESNLRSFVFLKKIDVFYGSCILIRSVALTVLQSIICNRWKCMVNLKFWLDHETEFWFELGENMGRPHSMTGSFETEGYSHCMQAASALQSFFFPVSPHSLLVSFLSLHTNVIFRAKHRLLAVSLERSFQTAKTRRNSPLSHGYG